MWAWSTIQYNVHLCTKWSKHLQQQQQQQYVALPVPSQPLKKEKKVNTF